MTLFRSGALLGALLCSAPVLAAEPDCNTCDKTEIPTPRAATPRSDAPTLGSSRAPVTIEVWSDFECPFCARGAERIDALRTQYGDRIQLVFRHRPLPMHKNAMLAAEASMEAHSQGRFWEFHDALFRREGTLDRAALREVSREVGLDLTRFSEAVEKGRARKYVQQDSAEAQRRGVTGTPTFFINGRAVVGAQPIEVLQKVVDEELVRAGAKR